MRHWISNPAPSSGDRYFSELMSGAILLIMFTGLASIVLDGVKKARIEAAQDQRSINQTVSGTRRAEAINARHEWSIRKLEAQKAGAQ